ncbi:hypothetical protein [Caballeronia sp. LjRoot31]
MNKSIGASDDHFLVRLPLAPGKYVTRDVTGHSGISRFTASFSNA